MTKCDKEINFDSERYSNVNLCSSFQKLKFVFHIYILFHLYRNFQSCKQRYYIQTRIDYCFCVLMRTCLSLQYVKICKNINDKNGNVKILRSNSGKKIVHFLIIAFDKFIVGMPRVFGYSTILRSYRLWTKYFKIQNSLNVAF